jgi:hypothetical protein
MYNCVNYISGVSLLLQPKIRYQYRPEEGHPEASSFPPGTLKTNLKIIHVRALIKNSQNKTNAKTLELYFLHKICSLLEYQQSPRKTGFIAVQ